MASGSTIRRILDVMLAKLGPSQLNYQLLVTLMAKVIAIINSCPISAFLTCPSRAPSSTQPQHAAVVEIDIALTAPPGNFTSDQYSRKHWRKAIFTISIKYVHTAAVLTVCCASVYMCCALFAANSRNGGSV